MTDRRQTSDAAQKGPGTSVKGLTPKETSSSPLRTSNGPSGAGVSGADKANRNKRS